MSGVALALNIATEFRRTGADRGSDPGEFVFWHRFVCEWLPGDALEHAWRKSAMPLTGPREKLRVPVPTSPIDGSDQPKVLVDTEAAAD